MVCLQLLRRVRGPRAVPGAAMALSGEPLADLNYLVLNSDSPGAVEAFREYVAYCDDARAAIRRDAGSRGLARTRTDVPRNGVGQRHVLAGDDLSRRRLSSAVVCKTCACARLPGLQTTSPCPRCSKALLHMTGGVGAAGQCPPQLAESPSIDIFLAERGPAVQSTVTVTWHGDVAGIWAMGTLGWAQGEGVGKALLVSVMRECRSRGIREFYLGATPAGFPLYETHWLQNPVHFAGLGARPKPARPDTPSKRP